MTTNVNTRRYGLIAAVVTLVLAVVIALVMTVTNRADASGPVGSSPDNPVLLASPNAPAGAVEDPQSTYNTPGECDTTRSWVRTVPGTPAVTHKEWTAEQRTRTKSQQPVYKTQYHFRKFTRIKTRTQTPAVKEVWANFAPTNTREPFVGPAKWPTDPRGKWIIHNSIPGGHEGPDGVYYKGDPSKGGNWFYRVDGQAAAWGEWSPFSDWTKWEPEQHTSWQDSNTPLGTPQFHGQGTYSNGTQWYREWQARFDGQTRQVQTGTQTIYGEWSLWTAYGTNPYKTDPVLPANTDVKEYRKFGPKVIEDQPATPTVVTYYAWSDGKVCDTVVEVPSFPTPTEPTCDTGGTLTVTPAAPELHSTTSVYPPGSDNSVVVTEPITFTEPGEYTIYHDPHAGYTFPNNLEYASVTVTVLPATGNCPVPPPTETPTPTVTPTPEPPVAVPPTSTPEPPVVTPEPKVKPSVKVSTRCTGTTRFVLNNKRSETSVPFKLKAGKWNKAVTLDAGDKRVIVKRLPNGVRAVVSTVGDRDSVKVPNPCPRPPRTTPHTGFRKAA